LSYLKIKRSCTKCTGIILLVGPVLIVFHHYHEKNKTLIRNQKVCKKVFGFDANALYLWAIGPDMLCGYHEVVDAYPGLVNDIMSGLFYGVVECDVQVPEGLKDYFTEMAPIFKNSDIATPFKNVLNLKLHLACNGRRHFQMDSQLSTMNDSNKNLTLFTRLPSKLLPELLPKSDVLKLILTLFAMEHLQSTTLLIQSICFFQLVNKPSL
jgi:hypothetical protein